MLAVACFAVNTSWAERTFREEFDVTVRIGRDILSDEEREQLEREIHPVLAMHRDKHTGPLVRFFANLPDEEHRRLLEKTYLKWPYRNLDRERQRILWQMVQTNVNMSWEQGVRPNPGFSVEALTRADVGVVVVDVPRTSIRYASLFILWPELETPTWVTVVNVDKVGTQAFFDQHVSRLAEVRKLPATKLPR
jgi:hypothetical protein